MSSYTHAILYGINDSNVKNVTSKAKIIKRRAYGYDSNILHVTGRPKDIDKIYDEFHYSICEPPSGVKIRLVARYEVVVCLRFSEDNYNSFIRTYLKNPLHASKIPMTISNFSTRKIQSADAKECLGDNFTHEAFGVLHYRPPMKHRTLQDHFYLQVKSLADYAAVVRLMNYYSNSTIGPHLKEYDDLKDDQGVMIQTAEDVPAYVVFNECMAHGSVEYFVRKSSHTYIVVMGRPSEADKVRSLKKKMVEFSNPKGKPYSFSMHFKPFGKRGSD
ncbi:hypothetical protein ADUPG1_012359, partial [Aduncisulcus paluster]